MRNALLILTLSVLALIPSSALAAKKKPRSPRVNYVLPAGGQQGTTFEVLVAGFALHGMKDAVVSGDGVHVKFIKKYERIRLFNGERRRLVRKELAHAMKELQEKGKVSPSQRKRIEDLQFDESGKQDYEGLPIHHLIDKLKDPTLEDLQRIYYEFFADRIYLPPNAAFTTKILFEVTIDPDATPGDREIRLMSKNGLTNPMCFQVGTSPEILEVEPNDPNNLPEDSRIKTPVVVNGQIRPGDVDRFRFHATRGQNLVISAQARRLVPYLADAVPGWFEAVVTLYDPDGKEIDFSDCYRFDPDPILLHRVKRTGDYIVEIRDSIYRGREDFVYRLSIGRAPLVTGIMPLGGSQSKPLEVALTGENLSAKTLKLDTSPGGNRFRQAHFIGKQWCPYPVNYAVDTLPECKEADQNDTQQTAQAVSFPTIVNGTIDRPDDADWFRFHGKAKQKVVVEVVARQLHSPLDSLIQLTDATGKVIAFNDDFKVPNIGLETHHADSYLSVTLPKDGDYFVHLRDTRSHGSPAHGYRLRISQPQPDFMAYLAPSSINLVAKRSTPVYLKVIRMDGFTGPIEFRLKEGADKFTLLGATIPAGQDEVTCLLSAPKEELKDPVTLHLEASAGHGKQQIVRPVVSVDDWEQAFIYKHLVPAEELMATVFRAGGYDFEYRLVGSGPVALNPQQKTTVRLESQMPEGLRWHVKKNHKQFHLALVDAPECLSLVGSKFGPEHIEFTLQVDRQAMEKASSCPPSGNLIVEVVQSVIKENKKGNKKTIQWPVGHLPPVPFTITDVAEKVAGK